MNLRYLIAMAVCVVAFVLAACSNAATKAERALKSPAVSTQPVLETPAGNLIGISEDGVRSFRGIPYAEPPVDSLRWKPPVEKAHWNGLLDAAKFGPACIQPEGRNSISIYSREPFPMSEDCLSLNIWTPEDATGAPVFVWIHGGAFWGGSGQEELYDGAPLAGKGMVVVTLNYRVGALGFLAHPELSGESTRGISGNYGLLDQVAALNWVARNIGAFGGDASNVTIAGESAGALSVVYLMASPDARGLFSKAIAQSAYLISMPELKNRNHGTASAEAAGQALVVALGVTDIADMRAIDAYDITSAAASSGFVPLGTVDGAILPKQLVDTFEAGEQAPVPLLAGFNSGEVKSMPLLAPPPPATEQVYTDTIRKQYADLADEFLRLYPSEEMQESSFLATTHALYGWSAEKLVRTQAQLGPAAYLYLFDHAYPAANDAGLHGFHASEIPYVFGTIDGTPERWPKIPNTEEERDFSETMISYWSSFAKTGTPVANSGGVWGAYGERQLYMAFDGAPHMSADVIPGMFELHEEAVCRRKAMGNLPWGLNVGVRSPPLSFKSALCSR